MGALPLSGLEVDCPLTWPFFWFWHLPVLRFRHGIFILAWHLQLLLFHETPRRRLVETGESLVDCSLGRHRALLQRYFWLAWPHPFLKIVVTSPDCLPFWGFLLDGQLLLSAEVSFFFLPRSSSSSQLWSASLETRSDSFWKPASSFLQRPAFSSQPWSASFLSESPSWQESASLAMVDQWQHLSLWKACLKEKVCDCIINLLFL